MLISGLIGSLLGLGERATACPSTNRVLQKGKVSAKAMRKIPVQKTNIRLHHQKPNPRISIIPTHTTTRGKGEGERTDQQKEPEIAPFFHIIRIPSSSSSSFHPPSPSSLQKLWIQFTPNQISGFSLQIANVYNCSQDRIWDQKPKDRFPP